MSATETTPAPDVKTTIGRLVEEMARRVGAIARKRSDTRYPLNAEVILGTLDGQSFLPIRSAWGFDISHHGVGLLCDHRFSVGQQLHLQLPAPNDQLQTVPILIVYSNHLFGSIFRIGVRFQD